MITEDNKLEQTYLTRALWTLGDHCYQASWEKGFWSDDPTDANARLYYDVTKLMLVVTELAEGVEGLRHKNPRSAHIPEFSAIEEEIADAIIRLSDLWFRRGWRVPEAIIAKLLFNATRPQKHGKVF